VPGPDSLLAVIAASALPALPVFDPLLAYGPAPGVELIMYFLGLLTWVGLALISIFLSPIFALLRRLRRGRSAPPAEPKSEPQDHTGTGK
jgi:hypothetical protein